MATTITALAPTLFSAAQVVSGEPAGVLDAINMTWDDKGVAKDDDCIVPYAPVQATDDFSPSNVLPAGDTNVAGGVTVKITQSKKTKPMVLTGEQIRSLENGGNYQEWTRQWAEQAMRSLRNLAEADAALAIKYGASRATGTAGTTPFATSIDSMVDVKQILRDNGAPFADPQLVITSSAAANFQKLGIYQQAYAAGSDEERRSGQYKPQFGFIIRDSAGIAAHTSGGGTSFVVDATSDLAIGSTSIKTSTAGSGNILAGDIVVLQSDTNKYVVNSSAVVAGTAAPFVIGRPGLRVATVAAKTITVGSGYTPCLAFERSAVVGIMRPPLMPSNPAIQQMLISDRFGHTYLMVQIAQYGQIVWEMHLAYGFKVVQPEHVAMILG